jgi:hypothetical protein
MLRRISVILLLELALAACSDDNNGGVVHIVQGDAETQAALTQVAHEHPSATPGPSPTPTITPTPYIMSTLDPSVDGSMVITRVGAENITLDDFQKQVRFERWYRLWQLARQVEEHGPEQILDLRISDNSWVSSLFATLADTYSFGIQVQRIMVIDSIARQESASREMSVNPDMFNNKLAQFLAMQVGEGGALPPEFDAAYQQFITDMTTYTGLTEEEFRDIVRARTLYSELEYLISNDPDAIPDASAGQQGVQVQDILLDTEEEAQQVIDRLQEGDAMHVIAADLGYSSTGSDQWRSVGYGTQNMPTELIDLIFASKPGDVIGPLQTQQGWYVVIVGEPSLNMLSPTEIENLRKQYFLNWVESRMDDTSYVEDFQNWEEYIPQEPIPQDVSPMLRDEYVTLPETPTPAPEATEAAE